jgi:DNA-directed RNA polymerase subunit RPC12/RpoP
LSSTSKCPTCKRQTMAVLDHDDKFHREFVCLHCGQKFFPVRLRPQDMARVQRAIEEAEAHERESAKNAFQRLKMPRYVEKAMQDDGLDI